MKSLPLIAAALLLVGCDSATSAGENVQTAAVTTTSAAGVVPVFVAGNTSGDPEVVCKALMGTYWADKVESPRAGTFAVNNFRFTVDTSSRFLEWNATGTDRMRAVFVKGGSNTFRYDYDGSLATDGGLLSPLNRGGNIPQVSNFIFCFTTDIDGH